MDNKEKWISLFEKVVGRKPNPQEFIAAKAGGFDFKQIKSIAGLTEESVFTSKADPAPETTRTETVQATRKVVSGTKEAVANTQVQKVKIPLTRKQKLRRGLVAVSAVLVVGMGVAYYYFNSITGVTVAAEAFKSAISSNDYDQIASLLSTKHEEWTAEEAKAFMAFLNDSEIDVGKELDTIADSEGKNIFHDTRGNKLLGMEVSNKLYGIFPEYQIKTYPLEIKVKTNMDDLLLEGQKIQKNEEVIIGETKFIPTSFQVKGKTDLGDMDTKVTTDLLKAENNQFVLSLSTNSYNIKANLPASLTNIKDIKLVINGKEVANSLSKDLKLMDNQEVDIHAIFNYEGTSYITEKVTEVANPTQPELSVTLSLSDDVEQKIAAAKKSKEEKEAQVRKDKETKDQIQSFMNDYIESMRSSISLRSVQFDRYFDTSSEVYNAYVDYIEGGGVERLKINYQTTIDYTVTDVKKDGDNYQVTVHNKFREVYLNGKSDTVEKNQVFSLRQNGDSFLIYGVSEK